MSNRKNESISESERVWLLKNWDMLVDKYSNIVGEYASQLKDMVVKLVSFVDESLKDGYATTLLVEDEDTGDQRIQVNVSDDILYLQDRGIQSVLLHEMCHCCVYFEYGSLEEEDEGGHGDHWWEFVEEFEALNNPNIKIQAKVDKKYDKWLWPEEKKKKTKKSKKKKKKEEKRVVRNNKRLLKENPTIERPDLKPVYDFAKRNHDATGIIRKNSGLPYFVHPEMVADVVMAYDGTEEEICAALCHDLLEDTDVTAEDLEELYGPDVAQIVEEVTNFKPEVDFYGKEQYINRELLELSDSALLVKCADMYCNLNDFPKPGQRERIIRNLKYMLDFKDDLDPRVRRLLKSIPEIEDEFDLDQPEFETSFEDELDFDPYFYEHYE